MMKKLGSFQLNQVYNMECIEAMRRIPSKSVDLILCDLPYGVTQNSWDQIIPFDLLWQQYKRIIKDRGAIVLTATFAFGAMLCTTASVPFRYDLVWEKNKSTGFLNANRMPLRSHELALVFYKNLPIYNPQKSKGHKPVNSYTKHTSDGSNYGKTKQGVSGGGQTDRHPTSVIKISVVNNDSGEKFNPTQKPVELFEWFIKTYTNEGAIVLDNCMGSFTTAVACDNLNRNWLGFEIDPIQCQKGLTRINENRERLHIQPIDQVITMQELLSEAS